MGVKYKIKPGEQAALEYFQSKGYANIVHEPEGCNSPPDLLIDDSIAVEVRRLNQFKIDNGIYTPLEDLEFDLLPRVRQLVKSFDSQPTEVTSYVSVSFKRPLVVDKTLLKDVKEALLNQLSFLDQHLSHKIGNNLELRFTPSTKKYNKPYVWASSSDRDGGGLVVSNILRSLKFIIDEKEEKIQKVKDKYSIWWLAVNDRIGYGIDEIDLSQLISSFNIETFFEKIIFISAFDSSYGVELTLPKK